MENWISQTLAAPHWRPLRNRRVQPDRLAQTLGDLQQAGFQRVARRGADYTGHQQTMRASVTLDYAVTGAFDAAIDSQDTHLRQLFHLRFVHVEVGENVLNVVVLFEPFTQPQHGRSVLAFDLEQVFGNHGDLGGGGFNAGFGQSL